jgi:DHA2 family multidrug resistance protein
MNAIPVFKKFAPEWLIRCCLLLVVLPGLILFVLSISNVNAAAGFYGISPNDVQYTCIIFYSAMASFVALEGRFFKFMDSKEYFLICTFLLILSCLLCYKIHSFTFLLIVRYIQGMLTCGTLNITMTLMFSRLHSERAREIAYSIV